MISMNSYSAPAFRLRTYSAHEDEPKYAPKFYMARTAPRYLWYSINLLVRAAAETGMLRLQAPPREAPRGLRSKTDELI
jgi:hypothetical protein